MDDQYRSDTNSYSIDNGCVRTPASRALSLLPATESKAEGVSAELSEARNDD
jgi:hypothetical protein